MKNQYANIDEEHDEIDEEDDLGEDDLDEDEIDTLRDSIDGTVPSHDGDGEIAMIPAGLLRRALDEIERRRRRSR